MKRITAVLLLICMLAGPSASLNLRASDSAFNPKQIERLVSEFYEVVARKDSAATDADLREAATGVADSIAVLDPAHYNSVVALMARDYRQNPGSRAAISLLMPALQSDVQAQLNQDREKSPLLTVMDSVFAAWTVAYSVGLGEGLLAARGSGLSGIEHFRSVVKSVVEHLPSKRRAALVAVGAGTPIGIAVAIYQRLETHRLDPEATISSTQIEMVKDLRQGTFAWLTKLRAADRSGARPSAEEAKSMRAALARANLDLKQLEESAPPLRPQIRVALGDHDECTRLLDHLSN